ncbi:hypothetical protein Vadar_028655 [Vaccinium darrowii]|uniref:Uncharacterized protein n=1 Tax=Vaccinium darrowii TaxID=229202 RepID=A0ACB7YGG4_9ERIC|nr:hypothetical protein Vadar_028655 [Vaccinium darrowii]
MVKDSANEFFPDEYICDVLIKGWCVHGKLEEARRLAREMHRGGFEIGVVAYNAILDCVCKLCRKKDPFRLQSEAEKVLVDMDVAGVPRNVETFNVLITNLCKIRKTEDAMNMFHRMGEWGCYPDETTYLVLIKSLYQAARIGEGDEMVDQLKSAGFGEALDRKAYYEFIKIFCGIERIDHAMSVFAKMKDDGCSPGIKTYDLLLGKMVAHGRVDKANALFKEAESSGVPVEPKAYKMDSRFVKKPPVLKKEKKRETLPEKMARKRSRLKKIRLSFVKKPRRAGWEGSAHDSRILDHALSRPRGFKVPEGKYDIGDAGYGVRRGIISPYRGGLTQWQYYWNGYLQVARMVLHPEIQAKAQSEIDSVVGKTRPVTDSDLPNLPYLLAIVKETLRMHPPGPLLSWARLAIHDTNVGGHFIPAGTTAMVNMWAITHDERVWPEPNEFKPERFVEEDVAIMGSDLRLAPFRSGRRVCPGKAMGLATVQLWLARLLQSFEWVAADGGGGVDLAEVLNLSMEMKNPLVCKAVARVF